MTQNAPAETKPSTVANPAAAKGKAATAVKGKSEEPQFEMPKGFQNQGSDIVGYYDPIVTGQVIMIPREAILLDGNIEARKTSMLIMAELVEPCKLKSANKDERDAGEVIEGKKGDIIGIWGQYGMKGLRNTAGATVCMYPNGKKDVGKPKPMNLFAIGSKGDGKLIPILEDKREESAGEATWLDPSKGEKAPF